ncbi:MAG: hypothetical protein NVSMB9_28510 [Isosphaeraceae bacterium]
MTVREMAGSMDSAEFSGWLAYNQLYGLDDGHTVAAIISSTVARSMTGAKISPVDFAPILGSGETTTDQDDVTANNRAIFGAIAMAMKARAPGGPPP